MCCETTYAVVNNQVFDSKRVAPYETAYTAVSVLQMYSVMAECCETAYTAESQQLFVQVSLGALRNGLLGRGR